MPAKRKILTRKHIAIMEAWGYSPHCEICGRILHPGEECIHKRSTSRAVNKVKLYCINHYFTEPLAEVERKEKSLIRKILGV